MATTPIDPLFGTALEVAGGVFSNIWGSSEASKNRAWMEMMSNTAHQREVKDLRAAGLNPILSAMHGPGASTPGAVMPNIQNPAAGQSQAFSAASLARIAQQRYEEIDRPTAQAHIDNVNADTKLKGQQTATEGFDQALKQANAELARTHATLNVSLAGQADSQTSLNRAMTITQGHTQQLEAAKTRLITEGELPKEKALAIVYGTVGRAVGYLLGEYPKGPYKPGTNFWQDLAKADVITGDTFSEYIKGLAPQTAKLVREIYDQLGQLFNTSIAPAITRALDASRNSAGSPSAAPRGYER